MKLGLRKKIEKQTIININDSLKVYVESVHDQLLC